MFPSTDTVPCDICFKNVLFDEYKQHIATHAEPIACKYCNLSISSMEYDAHIMGHAMFLVMFIITNTTTTTNNNNHNNNNTMANNLKKDLDKIVALSIELGDPSRLDAWIDEKIKNGETEGSILDEYDENNKYTPVIMACRSNNVATLQVLLKHGANPNLFYDPNGICKTTLHFAAEYSNISMMKLLFENGFDCDRLINNIHHGEHSPSVFLILCALGTVECMDYFINYAHNNSKKIEISQTTIESMNGLQAAIYFEQFKIAQYLLTNVYKNDETRMEVMKNKLAIINQNTYELAACNRSEDGLKIFKLLREYDCPADPADPDAAFGLASMLSPRILAHMLNEKLYPSMDYITNQLVSGRIGANPGYLIYDSIKTVVRYLHSIKDSLSIKEYKASMVNVLSNIMITGTFDGYEKFVKHLVEIFLDINDWKQCIKSDLIDKKLIYQILDKIKNTRNVVDRKQWQNLLMEMRDLVSSNKLENENDSNDDSKVDDERGYDCNERHLMSEMKTSNDKKTQKEMKKCIFCREFCNLLKYRCILCNGYVCHDCDIVQKLDKLLKIKEFQQFTEKIQSYNPKSKVLEQLCIQSDLLLYWVWNREIILPFYKGMPRDYAIRESLIYLFNNGANINKTFDFKFIKNQTLFNMVMQHTNKDPMQWIQLLIDYKFDFEKLFNQTDNAQNTNGLILLCGYAGSYPNVKLVIDYCKTLKNCNIDITIRDITGKNALHWAARTNYDTFKYLLSNVCFPNNDLNNKNGKIALNQQDNEGNTIAHRAAGTTFAWEKGGLKLLQKYKFNFGIYNHKGELPIHIVCKKNDYEVLLWMMSEKTFRDQINSVTRHTINDQDHGYTPLHFAVGAQSEACVNVLTEQANIKITWSDLTTAIKVDNVLIVKSLLCGLFRQHRIRNWDDIEMADFKSHSLIGYFWKWGLKCLSTKSPKCSKFIKDLIFYGYHAKSYEYIVQKLDYNIRTIPQIELLESKDEKELNKYDVSYNLGRGTFGVVRMAIHKKTGNKVAIKYVDLSCNHQDTYIRLVTSEIESLKTMSIHPNIIKLIRYQFNMSCKPQQVLLFFEFAEKGDLHSLLSTKWDHFHKNICIAFKLFLQLLSAIHACHERDIVHRDLKPANILLSNTGQLKVADFGLATIMDCDGKENIMNVGTPRYKAPELLQSNTKFNIRDIKVLKACDVFSMALIFWQLLNGTQDEYLPFNLPKDKVNKGNYKYIIDKKFDAFWEANNSAKMLKHKSLHLHLNYLESLFIGMFTYDPRQRLTTKGILNNTWIQTKSNDSSFYMNDFKLETYILDICRKPKSDQEKVNRNGRRNDSETKPDPRDDSNDSSSAVAGDMSSTSSGIASISATSNFLAFDSSYADVKKDVDKITFAEKPIVVVFGIGKYKNKKLIDKCNVIKDCSNVKEMLHDVGKIDVIYQKNENIGDSIPIVLHASDLESESKSDSEFDEMSQDRKPQFQIQWNCKDLDVFNERVYEMIEESSEEYDCLIYIVSSHMKHSIDDHSHVLYDSDGNEYDMQKIFDKFNNGNCTKLRKKAKVFILDGNDPSSNEINGNMSDNESDEKETNSKVSRTRQMHDCTIQERVNGNEIEFVDCYKRIFYSNLGALSFGESAMNGKNDKDGGLLINAFCASIVNSCSNDGEAKLDDIFDATQTRMNKHDEKYMVYDQNYVPANCEIMFRL